MQVVTICHICITPDVISLTLYWWIQVWYTTTWKKNELPGVSHAKQHADVNVEMWKTQATCKQKLFLGSSISKRPLISWHLLKELITYHRLGLWQRCFCGEQQCFWPHMCSCLYLPAGLFWWRDYGQPWWKNWGHLLGRSHPRFSATPPENMFQWANINCLSMETVSSCGSSTGITHDVDQIDLHGKKKGERYIFRTTKHN